MKPSINAKTERNKKLYRDWKAGMLGVDMVAKYRISTQAIYGIIKRIERTIDNSDNK